MLTIWYLMVAFTGSNGVAVIPEPDEKSCKVQAEFIMQHRFNTDMPGYAYCVPGLKTT